MTSTLASRLGALAERDAEVAPLARLQAIALESLEREPAWRRAAESPALTTLPVDRPLLDGATISVDPAAARALLRRIAEVDGATLDGVDPLGIISASIAERDDALERIADDAGVDPARLAALAQVLAWPLLLAIGERARPLTGALVWTRGHCPVCAAWPLLAELRGLDRERILRCGRCATAWGSRHALCAFCGNDDHRTLTYLAAEDERESRRAQVCARCRGYLKAVATLRPFDAEALWLADIDSLHLDVAAAGAGYVRPREPAAVLDVRIVPA